MTSFPEILTALNSAAKPRNPGQWTPSATAAWREMSAPDQRTMEAVTAWESRSNVRRLARPGDERAVMDLRSGMVIATAGVLIGKARDFGLVGDDIAAKPDSLKSLFDAVNGTLFSVSSREREVWQGRTSRFDFDGEDSFQRALELRELKTSIHKLVLHAPIPVEDRNEEEHRNFVNKHAIAQGRQP